MAAVSTFVNPNHGPAPRFIQAIVMYDESAIEQFQITAYTLQTMGQHQGLFMNKYYQLGPVAVYTFSISIK